MFEKLLVPVDGSKSAEKALSVACKLAQQDQAQLHILHIPEQVPHHTTLAWGAGAIRMEASQEEAEQMGKKVIEGARQAAADNGVTAADTEIQQGYPAQTILERAKTLKVDAIIMGSRGLSDIAGLIVGSVSHKVTHSAQCTVITVH